ncbi:MAG: transaldolase [Candidatus Binatia bacterium]|nr:transaldolase [Candidatus Binatia bacterium]
MLPTHRLRALGQSVWLDQITRSLLRKGTLRKYIEEFGVSGLTSNPTIFDNAIKNSRDYDSSISEGMRRGLHGEQLFLALALEDLREAADLFRPAYEASGGTDGFVSLEVSPELAYDTEATIRAASELWQAAERPNLFIKIPGTPPGLPAIEESIFRGVPVNVTLLFSWEHYLSAAEAYMKGVERRIAAGLDPRIPSVASLFVSRWDKAVLGKVPERLRNRLGYAVALKTYRAYNELLASERWQRLAAEGARPQKLLWASTGTKDPAASDVLYIEALAAPNTINTMPEETLLAFVDHGRVGEPLPVDGRGAEELLAEFATAGVDVGALAERLQKEGAEAFQQSWRALLERLSVREAELRAAV